MAKAWLRQQLAKQMKRETGVAEEGGCNESG